MGLFTAQIKESRNPASIFVEDRPYLQTWHGKKKERVKLEIAQPPCGTRVCYISIPAWERNS